MSDQPGTAVSPVRDFLLNQAVRFLLDPRVRDAPVAQRESFLKNKGLSETEISSALARADAALAFVVPVASRRKSIFSFLVGVLTAAAAGIYLYRIWLEYQQDSDAQERIRIQEEQRAGADRDSLADSSKLEIIRSLKQLSADHQIRHNEQINLLKSVLVSLAQINQQRGRKAASGIVVESRRAEDTEPIPSDAHVQNDSLVTETSQPEIVAQLRDSIAQPTVVMILQNILANPEDERYRKIQLTNPRFQAKLSSGPGLDCLEAAGFVKLGDVLMLPKHTPLEKLESLLVELESVTKDA